MEHMILPNDERSLFEVPYLCSSDPYDRKSFMGYPVRKQRVWAAPNFEEEGFVPEYINKASYLLYDDEEDSFLQSWLFFGILHELIGESYDETVFLRKDASHDTIHVDTSNLMVTLEKAMKDRFSREGTDPRKQLIHVNSCLRTVSIAIKVTRNHLTWRLKFQLSSLCETLGCIMAVVGLTKHIIVPNGVLRLGLAEMFDEELKQAMLQRGWCPSDIACVSSGFLGLASWAYLSRLRQPFLDRNHVLCSDLKCQYYQVDLASYKSKHHGLNCSSQCIDLGVDTKAVYELLKRGSLPILEFSNMGPDANTLRVKVIEATSETPYVAISHVWADGLGNPFGNSLPICQLQRFVNSTKTFRAKSDRRDSGLEVDPSSPAQIPLYLWLDTLCCPVEPPEARSLAIENMRRTYREASHVLVLDAALLSYDFNRIPLLEALFRIYTSAWTHRLWTLQEGILAAKLWFQFRDIAVDLSELPKKMAELSELDARLSPFIFEFLDRHSSLRDFDISPQQQRREGLEGRTADPTDLPSSLKLHAETGLGFRLAQLHSALQNRLCTEAADEALCVATLLDLPSNEILSVKPATAERRMAILWDVLARQHGRVSRQILCLRFPTLDTIPGKRSWAPRTFLRMISEEERKRDDIFSRLVYWRSPILGDVTPEGFRIESAALTFVSRESQVSKPLAEPEVAAGLGSPPSWTEKEPTRNGYRPISTRILVKDSCTGKRYSFWPRPVGATTIAVITEAEQVSLDMQISAMKEWICGTRCAILLLPHTSEAKDQLDTLLPFEAVLVEILRGENVKGETNGRDSNEIVGPARSINVLIKERCLITRLRPDFECLLDATENTLGNILQVTWNAEKENTARMEGVKTAWGSAAEDGMLLTDVSEGSSLRFLHALKDHARKALNDENIRHLFRLNFPNDEQLLEGYCVVVLEWWMNRFEVQMMSEDTRWCVG
ncbi:hypothetical protein MMC25_000374 [Agyrium rufum]|nr:hypothetical protein [Agyrium rufum]